MNPIPPRIPTSSSSDSDELNSDFDRARDEALDPVYAASGPPYRWLEILRHDNSADKLIGDRLRKQVAASNFELDSPTGYESDEPISDFASDSEGGSLSSSSETDEHNVNRDRPGFSATRLGAFDKGRTQAITPKLLNRRKFPSEVRPIINELVRDEPKITNCERVRQLLERVEPHLNLDVKRGCQIQALILLRGADVVREESECRQLDGLFRTHIERGFQEPSFRISKRGGHLLRELCFERAKILFDLNNPEGAYEVLRSEAFRSNIIKPLKRYSEWRVFNQTLMRSLVQRSGNPLEKARLLKKIIKIDEYSEESHRMRDCLDLASLWLNLLEGMAPRSVNYRDYVSAANSALLAAGTILHYQEWSRYQDLELTDEFRALRQELLRLNERYNRLTNA